MILHKMTMAPLLLLMGALVLAPVAEATDTDELAQMLNDFLGGVTKAETYDRFWADDLVYTSSRGTGTNKADIMAGFDGADSGESGEPGPVFSAEDVQIHVYDDTAVVAFRLVATPPAGSPELAVQNYLNTGTFLKRHGAWKAVA